MAAISGRHFYGDIMARIIAIYGDGRGKTTSAIGITIRMAAIGCRTLFAQFIKCDETGEKRFLEQLDMVNFCQFGEGFIYGTPNERCN